MNWFLSISVFQFNVRVNANTNAIPYVNWNGERESSCN